jgi:hypothetical protein
MSALRIRTAAERINHLFALVWRTRYRIQTAANGDVLLLNERRRENASSSARHAKSTVFIEMNKFQLDSFYANSYTYKSAYPSDNLFELQHWASESIK